MMEILKVGGSLLFEQHEAVAQALASRNEKQVVVIGYGPRLRSLQQMTGVLERRVRKMSGGVARVTDDITVATSYLASSIELNRLLEALRVLSIRCTGLYGFQGIICAARPAYVRHWDAGVLKSFEGDLSGRITQVEVTAIERELSEVECLVIAPILRDRVSGRLLVCDSDYAAVEIARSLGAKSLAMLTNVPGLEVDGKVVHHVASHELDQQIRAATGGMRKKLSIIQSGLRQGLQSVVVGDMSVLRQAGSQLSGTTFQ